MPQAKHREPPDRLPAPSHYFHSNHLEKIDCRATASRSRPPAAGRRAIGASAHEARAVYSFPERPRLNREDARCLGAGGRRFARVARPCPPSFAIAANTASAVSGTILLARVPRARAQSDFDQIDALESPDIGCFPDARMPAA
ncbi:hypothetical protein [Burkholderia thailandensis]|uniref:hypothetical protein n=1 Tax=Burkholderia thailandensis TaxID=57975 RepID=UPI00298F4596|nr:hypothetical protein [Burkholderia thailandensis]